MGKSVKLTDGSYIDTEGIWDNHGLQKLSTLLYACHSQRLDNSSSSEEKIFTLAKSWTAPTLLLVDQRGDSCAYMVNMKGILTLGETASGYTPTVTYANNIQTLTITLKPYSTAIILTSGSYYKEVS